MCYVFSSFLLQEVSKLLYIYTYVINVICVALLRVCTVYVEIFEVYIFCYRSIDQDFCV